MNKNSLLYWFEKIKDLDIPQPITKIIKLSNDDIERFWDLEMSKELINEVYKTTDEMGYPLFFRTDQASDKHGWEDTSFIQNKKDVERCIYRTIEHNLCASIIGLPFIALVFRKYIPLEASFKAFRGSMPVAKERRYFIKNQEIQCHHPYWTINSIEKPSVENWRELLNELNIEDAKEIELLSKYSLLVADRFKGYWSVDFAKSKEGIWYLIDMARGDESFHFIECEFCSKEMRDYYLNLDREKRERDCGFMERDFRGCDS